MKILQFPTLLWATGAADPDCQKVLITPLSVEVTLAGDRGPKASPGHSASYTVRLRELKKGALFLQTQPTQGFRPG